MIMRFRPANISLINRRHYLPRLLLTLFSKRQIQKPHQRFEDVDRVTPYQSPVTQEEPGSCEGMVVESELPQVSLLDCIPPRSNDGVSRRKAEPSAAES